MIEEFYDDLAPIVAKVAAKEAQRFKGYGADADDLQQECWAWACSKIDKIEEWVAADPKGWRGKVGLAMKNACKDAGQKVKAQHNGFSFEDLVHSVVVALQDVLPLIYHERVAELAESPAEKRDPREPVDARWAYEQLNANDRDLIDGFYRDGCRNKEMAEERGVSEQAMSDQHSRVMRRMALLFGEPPKPPSPDGEFEGWSGRRSVSSSAARAALRND